MRELHQLVVSLFVSAAELERHVRLGRDGAELYAELPPAALADIAHRWLVLLQARGSLDESFVDALIQERPGRAAEIRAVWHRYCGHVDEAQASSVDEPSADAGDVPTLVPGSAGSPRVFISYSHESEVHRHRVLELAQRLRSDGVDAWIDRFEPHQSDWALWMRRELDRADCVLCVCTPVWRSRYDAEQDSGSDTGVRYEGRILRTFVMESRGDQHKIAPVGFSADDLAQGTPRDLSNTTSYLLHDRYDALLAWVCGRSAVVPEELGRGEVRSEGRLDEVGPDGFGQTADQAIEMIGRDLDRWPAAHAKLRERFPREECVATVLTRSAKKTLRALRTIYREAEAHPEVYGSKADVAQRLRDLAGCALPWTEEWRDSVLATGRNLLTARDISDVVIDFVVSRMVAAPARPARHEGSDELRGEGHIDLEVVARFADGTFTARDPTVLDVALFIANELELPVPKDEQGRPREERFLSEVDEVLESLVEPDEDFEERELLYVVSRDPERRADVLSALRDALPSLWQVRLAKEAAPSGHAPALKVLRDLFRSLDGAESE